MNMGREGGGGITVWSWLPFSILSRSFEEDFSPELWDKNLESKPEVEVNNNDTGQNLRVRLRHSDLGSNIQLKLLDVNYKLEFLNLEPCWCTLSLLLSICKQNKHVQDCYASTPWGHPGSMLSQMACGWWRIQISDHILRTCSQYNTHVNLQPYQAEKAFAWFMIYTAKTSWLFQPQSGYPGCRQTGETLVMRGLLWY